MAAPGGCGEVRVRLTFEYPPPALPQSRHLWFMLDTEQCRAVTDVSAIIRERFFYSRGGALALYLDGCLLPPGESVRLIRDNDAISVKWEEPEDGSADCRRRPEDGSADCRRRPEDGSADCRRRPEDGSADCRRRPEDGSADCRRRPEDGSADCRKRKGVSVSAEDESDIPRKSKKRAVHESAEDESDDRRKSRKKGGPGSAEDESDDRRKSRKKGGPGSAEDESDDRRKSRKKGGPGSAEDESDDRRKSRKKGGPGSAEDESDDRRKSRKKGGPGSAEDESDDRRKSRKKGGPGSAEDESDDRRKSRKKGGPGSAEDESDDRRKSRKKGGPGSAEDESDDRRKSRKKGGPESAEDESDDRRKSRKKGGPESAEDESDDRRKSRKKGGPGSAEDESDDRRKSRKKGGPGSAEDESGVPEKTKKRAEVTPEKVSAETSEKKPSYQEEPGGLVHKETPPLLSSSRAAATSSSSSSSDQEDTGRGKGEEPGPPRQTQQRDGSIVKKPLISGLVSFPSVCNGRGARGGAQRRPPLKTAGRGLSRGRGIDNLPWGGRGFRGRGETQPQKHFFYNCSPEKAKEQQLSNVSVLIQNPPEVQKTDYGTLPLLAAPPQLGKIIAFKLLELTENYTPEVSDYKEGRVLSYDAVSQQLEVEILSQQRRKEPGKFDLVYEGEDGRNIVEYAVPHECKITQAWSSLIEPRLVTEHASPAAGP
ncbi:LOW QUALITY PROTEIN: coilin [Bufo bufo]|uniref:LOW QUALITY PROTEIN: coilin n=1 Tax=Bufo bufo TaxID=8384 RepID=UPI001ABE434C|nr:LOW QUALITY PROTEIN: coilin [Bufo bufo]